MPNQTQNKHADGAEGKDNNNVKANEQDTVNFKGGNQSTDGIKLASSDKTEPISEGNIAEEATDQEIKPRSTCLLHVHVSPPVDQFNQTGISSRTIKKHFFIVTFIDKREWKVIESQMMINWQRIKNRRFYNTLYR